MIKFAISTTLIHNHLGSASWITDASGTPIQHLRYLPYGETYVNERTSGYNERFTFTGKELDEETGYGYFGARYYDATLLTGWTAVDPMADKYPSLSPYNYCAWNPVKLVDPDGRECGDFLNENGELIGSDGKNDGKKYLLKMVKPRRWRMDTEADNSKFGIRKKERNETERFIKNNNGDESAFSEDCIAYENSVLIPTTAEEFREMTAQCKDKENWVYDVEYGGLKSADGNIYGGNDGTKPGIAHGERLNVHIKRNRNLSFRYWFHHHPDESDIYQMPSNADLNTFPDLVGYTISFRKGKIYVTQGERCQGYITFKGTTKF